MRRRVLAHSWTSAIRCGPDSDRPSTEALRRVSGLRSDLGANDFGQAQRAGARVVAVGEHQVEFAPALAALAQRQLFEYAAREVAAHPDHPLHRLGRELTPVSYTHLRAH